MTKNEQGTAAVEAAFIFPLIILLMIALAEYGHYYLTVYKYQQAVSSGARIGAIAPNDKSTAARTETERVLGEMGIAVADIPEIDVDDEIAGPIEGKTFIEVSIDTPFEPMVGYAAAVVPKRIKVVASQLNY